MTAEEINNFFLVALNYAINQLVTEGQLPATAVIKTATGECTACTLHITETRSKSEAIAGFVAELTALRPPCAVVVVPISPTAGKRGKRTTSLCVAFQSFQKKFVSLVNYEKSKKGEFVFDAPYFCDDTEIVLFGHEYFGDAFARDSHPASPHDTHNVLKPMG